MFFLFVIKKQKILFFVIKKNKLFLITKIKKQKNN